MYKNAALLAILILCGPYVLTCKALFFCTFILILVLLWAGMLSVSQPRRSGIPWQIVRVIRLLNFNGFRHQLTIRHNALSALDVLRLCAI